MTGLPTSPTTRNLTANLPLTNKDEPEKDSDPLEDNEEEPDITRHFYPRLGLWLTPLGYAILSGSLEVVDALLTAGADPSFVAHTKNLNPLHPLALTIYTQDEERAAKIAERLIAAQAISSTADNSLFTIFHRIVAAGKTKIVASLLEHDPNAKKVLNSPAWYLDRARVPYRLDNYGWRLCDPVSVARPRRQAIIFAGGYFQGRGERYAEHHLLVNGHILTDRRTGTPTFQKFRNIESRIHLQ
jgi:hypothetical protein